DRDGDLLLDLLGGAAGPLRDDVDVGVGDIGVGFDGELVKRDRAPDQDHESQRHDEDAVVQREIDQGANHYCSVAVANWSALETILSPGLSPPNTSWYPSPAIAPA